MVVHGAVLMRLCVCVVVCGGGGGVVLIVGVVSVDVCVMVWCSVCCGLVCWGWRGNCVLLLCWLSVVVCGGCVDGDGVVVDVLCRCCVIVMWPC